MLKVDQPYRLLYSKRFEFPDRTQSGPVQTKIELVELIDTPADKWYNSLNIQPVTPLKISQKYAHPHENGVIKEPGATPGDVEFSGNKFFRNKNFDVKYAQILL